ncbi:MAG: SGNH/GDSL hydrolase family protein [Bacteroidota bacterium]
MKLRPNILAFVFLLGLWHTQNVYAQQQVHRVLFVGNSYTYYHSMPQLFAAMAEHTLPEGHKVETQFLGGGGATLEKHWEVGLVQEALESGNWDYVVLQEQSRLGAQTLSDPESPALFYRYARMFNELIKASGAKTVLYMTWSRKELKEEQVYLTNAYTHMASELEAILAPVGLVWDRLRDDAALELYTEDGSHPSLSGSYLAASTLATTLFGHAEKPLPGALYGYEILRGGRLADKQTQLSNLPASQVQLIQRQVEEVVESGVWSSR